MKGHGHKRVEGNAPREVACDLESQKRAQVLCQTALAAVLKPVDGGAKRSGVGARAPHPKPASERDRLTQVTAGDAEPGARLGATGAPRDEQNVTDGMRE